MGRCSHDACTRQPNFNVRGKKGAAYCRLHATDGMVDVRSRSCSRDPCMRRPCFNVEGSKIPVYCRQHAEDGMVDVRHKRCSYGSCTRRPGFNVEGSKKAAYCRQHAEDGMVDVINRRCSFGPCTKRPKIYIGGSKTAAGYCTQHAEDQMVDVCTRRCSYDSCTRQPNFNVEGSKTPKYCKEHAVDGTVNVLDRGSSAAEDGMVGVDPTTKRCSHHSCTRRAVFGMLTDCLATVCFRHKSDILVGPIINFRATCKAVGCCKLSRWGLDGKQPTHCPDHGLLQDGLVCTLPTARKKSSGLSQSHHAVPRPSVHVKTECSF